MDLPVAVEIPVNTITVDIDKISGAIAEQETKFLQEKYAYEKNEIKRLTDSKIQFERLINDENIKLLQDSKNREEKRKDAEWRLKNPTAAKERDLLEVSLFKRDLERRKHDTVYKFRSAGYVLIGAGVGLLLCSSL